MKLVITFLALLFVVACSKSDPVAEAEKHLALKLEYLTNKAKVIKSPETEIVNIKSQFPKSNPMPDPFVSRIQFSIIHYEAGQVVLKENFQVTFEFKSPYWTPTKMESEKLWTQGKNEPWTEITRESNRNGWQAINSLLGLFGP